MYHRPRPEGPGLALYPPGCQRVKATKRHRRQPVEGIEEATDQVTALAASDQYTEGILLSVQSVCIVTYVVIVSSVQSDYIVGVSSSVQCGYIVGNLSSAQCDCIVGVSSSAQCDCIVGVSSSTQ